MIQNFKKVVGFLALIFLITNQLQAQWIPESGVPYSGEVYDIKAFDSQFIYGGGNFCFIRSLDGGASWDSIPIVDNNGLAVLVGQIKTIHFTSPTEGVFTGLLLLGNDAAIFKTSNGGLNWTMVYQNNSGGLPRFLNQLYFVNNLTGWAVGYEGRILKTINGGTSWSTQNSTTLTDLEDVYFPSATSGFAVGGNVILNTTNSGTNWTFQSFPSTYFNAVHFPSTTVGYAAGANKKLYKTNDSGISWSPVQVNVPGSFDFTSIYFSSANTGYATTDDGVILKTTDGGIHWGKFSGSSPLNNVSFRNATDAWASGENGTIYHTTNTGDPYNPIAIFEYSPTTICQDSLISLNNLSASGNSYSWYLNNQFLSGNYNASVQLNNANQADTISLVVSNGTLNDTMRAVLNVQQSLQIPPISATVNNNSICSGQTTMFQVTNSQLGTTYGLRINNTNVGNPLSGNGGTLTFNSGIVNANTIYNIRALRTVAGCGSDSLIQFIPITLSNPDSTLTVSPLNISICKFDSVVISLNNSISGIIYQLIQGTTTIGATQTGNGSTLQFNTGSVANSGIYSIYAMNPTGCSSTMVQKTNINVEITTSRFGLSNMNPETGENIFTLNGSFNTGGTYYWDFGAAASIQTSNLPDVPVLSYSTPGTYTITLVSITSAACTDTSQKTINVHALGQQDACKLSLLAGSSNSEGFTALAYDPTDNSIVGMYNGTSNNFITYGLNGDTLRDINYLANPYYHGVFLVKYNAKGYPMWTTKIMYDTGPEHGDLAIDSSGNIYCSYLHYDHVDSVRVYSSDGTYFSWRPILIGNNYPVIVVKYDKNGIYQWHRFNYGAYNINNLVLELDADQNIYSLCSTNMAKWNSQGQFSWSLNAGLNWFADLSVDDTGNVYILRRFGLEIEKYDSAGNFLSTTPEIIAIGGCCTFGQNMTRDDGGNFYVSAFFRDSLIFNGDTIVNYPGYISTNEDGIIMKLGPSGQHIWLQQLRGNGMFRNYEHRVKNATLVSMLASFTDTIYFDNLPPVTGTAPFYFLYVSDTSGNSLGAQKIYQHASPPYGTMNYSYHRFDISTINDEIAAGFPINTTHTFGGDSISPYTGFAPQVKSSCLDRGELECFIPGVIPQTSPNSFFSASSTTICAGQQIQLSDLSDHSPTSWNWTMPGATPASSTSQNPVLTYNSSGTYVVTLTASNSIGIGTSYSMNIIVSSSNSLLITGVNGVCPGQTAMLAVTGGGSYYWSNGVTGSSITVSPSSTTTYTVTDLSSGCLAEANHTVTVYPQPVVAISTPDPIRICQGEIVHLSATSGMATYQWYKWNNTLSGAVSSNYNASLTGQYKCKITDSNGCEATSNVILVRVVCLPPADPVEKIITEAVYESEIKVTVYPNPSNSDFIIKTDCFQLNSIEIYNTSGSMIETRFRQTDANTYLIESLSPGIYFARVYCGDRQKVVKLISAPTD